MVELSFAQLLEQMQLGAADFVARWRELSKLCEVRYVDDQALSIDLWKPTTAGSFTASALADVFHRTRVGWDINMANVAAVSSDLFLSLDLALPAGYSVTKLRLEYATNSLFPAAGANLWWGTYNRAAGSFSFRERVTLVAAPGALAAQTINFVLSQPLQATPGLETFAMIDVAGNAAGAQLRVKTLYATYSYGRIGSV